MPDKLPVYIHTSHSYCIHYNNCTNHRFPLGSIVSGRFYSSISKRSDKKSSIVSVFHFSMFNDSTVFLLSFWSLMLGSAPRVYFTVSPLYLWTLSPFTKAARKINVYCCYIVLYLILRFFLLQWQDINPALMISHVFLVLSLIL